MLTKAQAELLVHMIIFGGSGNMEWHYTVTGTYGTMCSMSVQDVG
jgi:hypothetical protein